MLFALVQSESRLQAGRDGGSRVDQSMLAFDADTVQPSLLSFQTRDFLALKQLESLNNT